MNKCNRNLNKKVDITHIIQMFMTRKYMIIIKGGNHRMHGRLLCNKSNLEYNLQIIKQIS